MSADLVLAAARFAHFVAVLALAGTVMFRRHIAGAGVAAEIGQTLRRWERRAAVKALAMSVLWLLAESAIAGDGWASALDPATITSLLTDTFFGWVWLARFGIGLLVAGLAYRRGEGALEAGAVLYAASLGYVGHGVMLSGGVGVALAATLGVHVLAAGMWLGALPALALALRSASTADLVILLQRFSRAGHWAVAVTLAAGFGTAQAILGGWVFEIGSPYQALLGLKVSLVAVIVAAAVINSYVLAPRLLMHPEASRRWLLMGSGVEIAVGLLVLASVSVLGDLAPMG